MKLQFVFKHNIFWFFSRRCLLTSCKIDFTTTQLSKIQVPSKNIETWSPFTGHFPSEISCGIACAQSSKECKFFLYDETTKECKTGNFGLNDHEPMTPATKVSIWYDESKFCTGEPNPVANGRWVCHRKSSDSRCYLVCDIGYYADHNVIPCRTDPGGKKIWKVDLIHHGENGYQWYKCRETVILMMGGEKTYTKVQVVTDTKVSQLPDFYTESNANLGHGTFQFLFGQVLYYNSLTDIPQCYKSIFNTASKYPIPDIAKADYGHVSVRMDLVYLLTEQIAQIVVQQLTDGHCDTQKVSLFTTIKLEDELSSEFGCAARFTDYSIIYIGGKKAVEINLITKDYTILPGELNYERKKAGCDLIMVDGIETVLVAGGIHGDAQGTSEYFDKNLQGWTQAGNLNFKR